MHLELQIKSYDFFEACSIFWNFLDYFKSRKSITASALLLGDVSGVNRPVQVKPDQWGPLVSDPEQASDTDRWGPVNR